MRLKSLYIKGFKSFANETILHFNEDVIGIVGPNGSGKSNIVDAIRWVLGEQKSKELRLETMSDVIFNGTKKRKQSPTAIVELTFDNNSGIIGSEYNTISISRTIYRSGESEYRLNNVPCRLKDITTLFMDTGIGSNSYAIIALGMVDDILSDKDNARRKMFEQAAGVSKYKKRKKETLRKLKSTTEDLDRINDLLYEIEGNMKSLEKQAKRTKKYFEIKEKYKEYSIDLASRSIHTLKEDYKALNKKLAIAQDEYQSLQANLNVMIAEVEEEKKKHLDKEIVLSEKQKELNELVSSLRNAENEKDLIKQKIEFKKSNIQANNSSIETNKVNLSSLEVEIQNIDERISIERQKEVILREDLEVLQKKYEEVRNSQDTAKQMSDLKSSKLREIQDKIHENEKRIAITNNNIETIGSEINILKQQMASAKEEVMTQSQAEKELDQQIKIKSKELDSAKSQESFRLEKVSKLQTQKEEIQQELNQINRTIDSKQNEYELLKSMVENFEGFPASLKFLSNNWRKDIPVLSDLLDVNDDYKSTIEQYLEPYLNYFVVHSIDQAKEAINLLKGAQKGKANFFLLDELPKVISSNDKIDRAIAAISVINVDSKYQNLVKYLLQNAYVFDGEIDDFIINKQHEDKIFLSKFGTFIKTKVSISGGSVGLFEGKKIGRKKNLEKIQEFLDKSATKKEKIELKHAEINEDLSVAKSSSQGVDIDKLRSELNRLLNDKTKISSTLESIESQNKEKESRLIHADLKIKELKLHIQTLNTKQNELISEEKNIHKLYQSGGVNLEALNDALRMSSDSYNMANIELIKQQNLLQNYTKEQDYKKSRTHELSQRLTQEINKLDKDKKELEESLKRLNEVEANLVELYKEKGAFQGVLTQAEQDYYKARSLITNMEEKVKAINRNLNQKQVEINTLKDNFNDVRFKISAVGERLKIEFDIDINSIINDETSSTTPIEELNESVERIRKRLANYGEINPMALEAYDEIKERYDNIIVQQEDILEAKESLMATIKEIETTAESKFMASFSKVRENFILVFRSLFTEDDNCDLLLVDEDNPLESDIEIVAKPKGKKPRSLSQLSGGEKTLTATALLFALYLLKPAPFCIFDEVDAPLDDANIQKFNKIINKFSKKSQFIVVTHNKATMSAVDVLYGVYMQEVGVSGVAPVDFRALKEQDMFEQVN